jgi:membrane protease YdiL (CAAX protease family)
VAFFSVSSYRAHDRLTAPARSKSQLWRLFMGLVLVAGVFLASYRFVEQTLVTFVGEERFAAFVGGQGASSPGAVLYILLSFGFVILGVAVALRVVHQRGLAGVLGPWALLRQQFWSVLAIIALLYGALALLPPWDMGDPLERNLTLGTWLVLLPFGLMAILVQVSAEEILFRGYLQQQLAARFSSPLIWLAVPSALFGAGHYMPAAGDLAMVIALWSGLFGLAMADLTARAGTLGPAIALHLANNAVAILVISMPDSLSGLALYHSPFDIGDDTMVRAWLPVEFMMILVCWLAARLAIRR